MTSLGLEWNPYVTQIEPHDYIAGAASAWWDFFAIPGVLPRWWLQAVLLSHFSRDDNYEKHHFAHAAQAVNVTFTPPTTPTTPSPLARAV